MAANRIDRVRTLVHRLDDLEARRAELDAQITAVSAELEALAGGGSPKPSKPPPATQERQPAAGAVVPRAARGAHAELALELVSKNPRIGYGELAEHLYGSADEAARGRARSVIHFLVTRARKLRRTPEGELEVLPPSRSAETGT